MTYVEAVQNYQERDEQWGNDELVKEVWSFLPRARQGQLAVEGFISYEDILLVDAQGDAFYRHPHIYVEFLHESCPYAGTLKILTVGPAARPSSRQKKDRLGLPVPLSFACSIAR